MTCDECDKVRDSGKIYPIRVGNATVGVVACLKHFEKIREMIIEDQVS